MAEAPAVPAGMRRRADVLRTHLGGGGGGAAPAAAPRAPRAAVDYDAVRKRYADFREARLRDDAASQFTSDIDSVRGGAYTQDPWSSRAPPRDPIHDDVEVLIIGGGFSALFVSARLRECGVQSIRIVERGSDVGGTWYWNRYPGVECDVPSYDYLPLLDELDYVPLKRYAGGAEIYQHCRKIAEHYKLYDLALFHTTVSSTRWDDAAGAWRVGTDRGDDMRAKFVVCANGTLSKPKLPRSLTAGLERFRGASFHTSRWDYATTGKKLERLEGLRVGIVGTGASAVQAIPELAKVAGQLYVFQRTPSSIAIRGDWPTDPNWARRLKPGWQAKRRARMVKMLGTTAPDVLERRKTMSAEAREQRAQEANMRAMAKLHDRIDEVVRDRATAEALKPWYMMGCKRPCFHDGFLPAFNQPNVTLVDTRGKGIEEVTERGPVFAGKEYELDLLIMATGFEVQVTGIYNNIIGTDGEALSEKVERRGIRTLLGIHSCGFPNMFVMGGYQASFSFNLTDVLGTQGAHIARCIDHCRREGGPRKVMECRADAEEWWVQKVIENRGRSNYSADCTPGYYNFEGDKNRRRQDGVYRGDLVDYYGNMDLVAGAVPRHFELS